MARRRQFGNARDTLKAFGKEWVRKTRDNVSGAILKRRSGRLLGSITLINKTRRNPAQIIVQAETVDPQTGFFYAVHHEFFTRFTYIRTARQAVMPRWFGRNRGGSIFAKAAALDSENSFIDELDSIPLWRRSRLRNQVIRRININMGGVGSPGVAFTPARGFIK